MSFNSIQIKIHDYANTDYIGFNLMTYNPAAIGLEDMDFWHPPINPAPVVPVEPVPFFITIHGHQFIATPLTRDCERVVRRVINGERQDFIIGTFPVPADEFPELFLRDHLWSHVLAVADEDPDGWRNTWTAEQIEQAGYDAAH